MLDPSTGHNKTRRGSEDTTKQSLRPNRHVEALQVRTNCAIRHGSAETDTINMQSGTVLRKQTPSTMQSGTVLRKQTPSNMQSGTALPNCKPNSHSGATLRKHTNKAPRGQSGALTTAGKWYQEACTVLRHGHNRVVCQLTASRKSNSVQARAAAGQDNQTIIGQLPVTRMNQINSWGVARLGQ